MQTHHSNDPDAQRLVSLFDLQMITAYPQAGRDRE
jgi:hypothetical protein